MRFLARRLAAHDYTVSVPIFTGHATGDPADILRLGSPTQWWTDTRSAIADLRTRGYQQIAILGLSLGGLFATRALQTDPQLVGGGTLASPVIFRGPTRVPQTFVQMARAVYQRTTLSESQQQAKLAWIRHQLPTQLTAIQAFTDTTATHLDRIQQPFFIAQGTADEMIDPRSGQWLAAALTTEQVTYHEYPQAGHVLTVNAAHHQLETDILQFLHLIFEK